jgi:hypothetical protein
MAASHISNLEGVAVHYGRQGFVVDEHASIVDVANHVAGAMNLGHDVRDIPTRPKQIAPVEMRLRQQARSQIVELGCGNPASDRRHDKAEHAAVVAVSKQPLLRPGKDYHIVFSDVRRRSCNHHSQFLRALRGWMMEHFDEELCVRSKAVYRRFAPAANYFPQKVFERDRFNSDVIRRHSY